jgi:organic hydroperoxide reductase OsmC/OhrA
MQESFTYHATVAWTEKKKGTISFEDEKKQHIAVAVAPEFMGHSGIATPEELFVSSVASCHMAYFLGVAEKMRVKFNSYECEAEGNLTAKGMDFVFSSVTLKITVGVPAEKYVHKAERALDLADKGCFVANSIRSEVSARSTVHVVTG